jgi:hypothetical protein
MGPRFELGCAFVRKFSDIFKFPATAPIFVQSSATGRASEYLEVIFFQKEIS